MFGDIKILGKETVIYGISTIVARLFNFILLPLYTYYLSPDEYGIVATVFSAIAFLNVIYGLGLNQGYMRFYKEEKSLSFTMSMIFFSSTIFSFLLLIFSSSFSKLLGIGNLGQKLLVYSSIILFFDSLSLIPLTDFRMKHKSWNFVLVKMLSIFINLFLNIFFLKYLKLRSEGIFLAGVISSFSQIFFIFKYFKYIRFNFPLKLANDIFTYSLPYIPSSLSSVTVQLIDRPIMMNLLSPYMVGIYQANFRLSIFMNLVISMFDFAWRPFVMERISKDNAKEIFKKVFEYFSFLLLFIWLFFSLFLEDLIKISFKGYYFINPSYWSGIKIVPIVMLAYFFNGLYINFMIGPMITKKTFHTMLANIISAFLSVILNLILIPKFSIFGASYSILIAYIFFSVYMYFVTQKLYAIDYNIKKVFLLFLSTLLFFLSSFFLKNNPCLYFQYKLFIILIYPLFVFASGYFSPEEKEKILKILRFYKKFN